MSIYSHKKWRIFTNYILYNKKLLLYNDVEWGFL